MKLIDLPLGAVARDRDGDFLCRIEGGVLSLLASLTGRRWGFFPESLLASLDERYGPYVRLVPGEYSLPAEGWPLVEGNDL